MALLIRTAPLLILVFLAALLCPQEPTRLSPTLSHTTATDPATSSAFARLYLTGQPLITSQTAQPVAPSTLPTLTLQCSQGPGQKATAELLVNFEGSPGTSLYKPRRQALLGDSGPGIQKTTLTLQFLGYTRVRPLRLQFQRLSSPSGQLRFEPASLHSSNMESLPVLLRYMLALPTLRISDSLHTVTFETQPLLAQLRAEPLCLSAGL